MCLNPKDPEAHRIYTEGGGDGRDPIAFNWYVGGNNPAIGDGVCCTLQCSDAHCPAVVIWEDDDEG